MLKLNDKLVRSLGPGSYTDAASPVVLRVRESGSRFWVVRHMATRANGKRYQKRTTIGRYPILSLAEARRKAATVKYETDHHEHESLTILQLIELFRDQHVETLRPATRKGYDVVLFTDVARVWADRDANSIRRGDVIDLMDRIQARAKGEKTNATVANVARRIVSSMFSFAVSRGYVEHNPVLGTKPRRTTKTRGLFLRDSEVVTLWDCWTTDGSIPAMVMKLLLTTAQRPKDVMGMRWDEIDGADWVIPAERYKSGLDQLVPLTDFAVAQIERMRGLDPEWVFPARTLGGPVRWLSHAVARHRKQTGIADWTPHALRATAAEGMTRLEIDPHIVSAVLGHAPQDVTAVHYTRRSVYRYARGKREALEAWNAHLAALVSPATQASISADE